MIDTMDDIVQEIDSYSKLIKVRMLAVYKNYIKEQQENNEIYEALYNDGKQHTLVAVFEDYAIFKTDIGYHNHDKVYYTPVIKINNKWKDTSIICSTIEEAILTAIGCKYEGQNSRYAYYAYNMIQK